MRILVLDANYPSDDNLYGDVFVHVRVAAYIARGHTVRVVAFFSSGPSYVFDGVEVSRAHDLDSLKRLIAEFRADVVAIHFFQGWMLRKLIAPSSLPVIIWVHGMEALGWYRRLFNASFSREFYQYVRYAVLQQFRFRQLLRFAASNPLRVRLIFVSRWMRRVAERDAMFAAEHAVVIPNPVDPQRFPYVRKDPALRTKVLLIRSFDSRKYANDVAVEAILRLSSTPEFHEYQFSLHGRGRMMAELTEPLRKFPNVSIQEGFLTQSEVRRLHLQHGIFLCPTRQDAQGVSMCEAMASGLVPVTSNSTAIPEFVSDGVSGFLGNSAADAAEAIRRLRTEPGLFERMSEAAARESIRKSGLAQVIDRELAELKAAGRAS